MKNKFLVGVITVFFTLILGILLLNLFDSESKKDYFFVRNFANNKVLKFEKRYEKMNEGEYVMYINSDDKITERDKKIIDKNTAEYRLYFTDLKFKDKISKNIFLPSDSNVILCNTERLFYTNTFKLFEYDFLTKNSREIELNNFKIFSLKSISNTNSKFLCFGEWFHNNSYLSGFFIIDINDFKILPTKILETTTTTSMPKNALIYSGSFTKTFDKSKIIYSCDKYSKIYFFNEKGFFLNELTTKDKTPKASILTNTNGDSFYSRGDTWNTNMGVFMKNDKVFVFSSRSNDNSNLIFDEYSYNKLEYVKSYKLNYNNLNSHNIRNIYSDKDRIVIGFEFYYASFIF
jgi:hypothetical protein